MTVTFNRHLCTALLGVALFSSCSRPVAYFQRGPVDASTARNTQSETIAPLAQPVATTTQPLTQANTAITQLDAYVQKDSKLATNKILSKRIARIKNLLASTTGTLSQKATNAPHKANLMERLMLKKMNKQISKQLAPNHVEKAMLNKGKLIGGIILLIAGIVLLIAGSGTAIFIGILLSILGVLGVLVGLLGI